MRRTAGSLDAARSHGHAGRRPGLPAPAPAGAHWGHFQWRDAEVPVRAFVLFDRAGDPTLNAIIKYVSDWWNGQRVEHPELPFSFVYRDDANAGRCFVNQTLNFSSASACMIPSLSEFGIKGIAATHGSPHLVGGAFSISDRLPLEESFTVVCHNFGHIMGPADSDDETPA